jgi:hypothetical protein
LLNKGGEETTKKLVVLGNKQTTAENPTARESVSKNGFG